MAPPIGRGVAEPLTTSDATREYLRLGLAAEEIQAQLHGRYYEAARRGLVFVATQTAGVQINTDGATATSFCLVNPAGSGRLVIPIRWDLVVTTFPTTPIFGIYSLYASKNTVAAQVTGTAVSEIPAVVGTNGQPVAKALSSATLPAAPTFYRLMEMKGTDSKKVVFGKQIPDVTQFFCAFDGTMILAPGTALSLQQDAADTSNGSGICSVIWEEQPFVDSDLSWEMGG